MRPGISNETLTLAGVRLVTADEAKALCGLPQAGLWLPYRNLDGSAVRDGDKDYGRLRLDQPRGDMKYYQTGGTTVHAYLPPTVADVATVGGDLCVVEGEFKSLSLTEAGFPVFMDSHQKMARKWCRSWPLSWTGSNPRAFCSAVIPTRP